MFLFQFISVGSLAYPLIGIEPRIDSHQAWIPRDIAVTCLSRPRSAPDPYNVILLGELNTLHLNPFPFPFFVCGRDDNFFLLYVERWCMNTCHEITILQRYLSRTLIYP